MMSDKSTGPRRTSGSSGLGSNQAELEKLCEILEAIQEPIGIESSLAQLGCIKDADGNFLGSVMICKTVDEATGAESTVIKAFYTDGTEVSPYTGPWSECSAPMPQLNLGTFCY